MKDNFVWMAFRFAFPLEPIMYCFLGMWAAVP